MKGNKDAGRRAQRQGDRPQGVKGPGKGWKGEGAADSGQGSGVRGG